MDVRKRGSFLLGTTTNWLAFAATLAVSFFLTPYLISSLGKARYDVWCVVESILAYFTLLDMGVAACLVRFVARHHASEDRAGLNRIASACLAIFLAAGLVAFVIGTPILFLLSPRMEAKIGGTDDVLAFMLLMLANLAATIPLSVFPSILDGLEQFAAKSAVRVVFLTLRTAGIVLVVNSMPGLFPLAVVYTIVNILEHLAMAMLCHWHLPTLCFSRRFIDRETLRQVRGYSVDAFLAMLAGRITVQTGAIVVGLMLPAGQVTFFVTAVRLVEYAKTLLRTITTTLTPGVSALEARGDFSGIRHLFLSATRWLLYIVIPIHLGLVLFGKPFLARWVGDDFVLGSYPSMVILALTLTLGVAQSVASRILYGLGRLRLFARVALVEAGVNLVLTFLFIQTWGVQGVSWAITLPNLAFCLVVITYTAKQLDTNIQQYLAAWLRPILANSVPLAVWLSWGPVESTWLGIGLGIGVGLVPYAVTVIGMEFRQRITDRLSRVLIPVRSMSVDPR